MRSLILRIISQLRNDKRILGLLFVAPLLVITLVYFVTGESSYQPTIAVRDLPAPITSGISEGATVIEISSDIDIDAYLKDGGADAVIWLESGSLHIRMLESSAKTALVTKAIKNAMPGGSQDEGIVLDFVYGIENAGQFNSLGYVFLGIISFFFVFIIAGMSLVRERSSQTLERLMMTPIRRYKVIGGYTIGFGIVAMIQSVIIFCYSHYVLGLESQGSVLLCIFIMMLLAFVAVSMGALASIFANSEFQVAQFIPVLLIPQVFFCGLIPLDTIPYGLGKLCYIMPVYYGCTALKMVMIEAADIVRITPMLVGLLVYTLVLFTLNTVALKKYRSL